MTTSPGDNKDFMIAEVEADLIEKGAIGITSRQIKAVISAVAGELALLERRIEDLEESE